MTDSHRQWIEERYREGWKSGFSDEDVKIFQNNGKKKDFAYHKISVVFWQTDENDQPAIVTEKYEKSFTTANMTREQAFYDSELVPSHWRVRQIKRRCSLLRGKFSQRRVTEADMTRVSNSKAV